MASAAAISVAVATAFVAAPVAAQRAPADTAPASACWQFAFGEWAPPLDWARAGHAGTDSGVARRVQTIRDSVFDRDPVATRNSAMEVRRTVRGVEVMVYPSWWPAGVALTFDSSLAAGRELTGIAVALVADGRSEMPRAPARARPAPCVQSPNPVPR